MSLYGLQKLIRDINRMPSVRDVYFAGAKDVFAAYDLTVQEIAAVEARNWTELYRMGVHGLLLRPFSIIHQVPEPEYLTAIRETMP